MSTTLGRGRLFFDRFAQGTLTRTGELALGNTPSFGLSVETQELEHFSSQEGLRIKDLTVTLSVDYSGTFVTDDINQDNLAMFFFGENSTVTQGALTGEQDDFTAVLQNRFYQLGVTPTRLAGVQSVSVTSVTGAGGTPTYVLNTDYRVHEASGRIEVLSGGGIADGTDIQVTYNVASHSHSQVISSSNLINGAMRFISANGTGEDRIFYMPRVTLRPNGEYALIGEDWQQFGFNVEILKLDDNTPNIILNGVAYQP